MLHSHAVTAMLLVFSTPAWQMRDWLMTTPQLSYRAGLVLEW